MPDSPRHERLQADLTAALDAYIDANGAAFSPVVVWGIPDRTTNPFLALSRSCEIAAMRARLPRPPTRKARRGRMVAARQCPTCGRAMRVYGRSAVCFGCGVADAR